MYKKLSEIKAGTQVIIRDFESDDLYLKLDGNGLCAG